MRKQFVVLLVLLVAYTTTTVGQEVLLDLQTMPIKKVVKSNGSILKVKSKSSLGLPFFDDFAKGSSYTDPGNWVNSNVIINQTYAINPPSIGVATFDAIDQYGKLYSHLTTSSLPADTLTSQLINTDTSTNVYFSFQYEPKGLGKEPSLTDSLVIEFFSKSDKKWFRVWSASPHFSTNTVIENFHLESRIVTRKASKIAETFFKVMMPIYDERFLQDSFQFRFINYASLPTNTQVPSLRGNGDQWHIDYLYLNRNRYEADTIPFDVVFSQPEKKILKNYESVPWNHFGTTARLAEFTDPLSVTIQFRDLSGEKRTVEHIISIIDYSNPSNSYKWTVDNNTLYPFETMDSTILYEYDYTSSWEDSAKFSVENYIVIEDSIINKHFHWNDTVRHTLKFLNYYAYDDGSAENGYGLYGNGSEYGMVALKYHTYLEDSLKGVEMYFNRSLQDDNLLYIPDSVEFYLTVWTDNNGKPGSILYQSDKLKPKFKNGASSFSFYPITSKLKVSGNFWVGWTNTTTDFLNVGFDLNNIHNDKLYYNLNGSWVQSQFEGSLMIHPVFGYLTKNQQTGVVTPTQKTNFTLYPNPASSQVNLKLPEGVKPERIRVFNLAGQVVVDKVYDSNSIDVSNLTTGIYLLQLTIKNSSPSTQKLVIIR